VIHRRKPAISIAMKHQRITRFVPRHLLDALAAQANNPALDYVQR